MTPAFAKHCTAASSSIQHSHLEIYPGQTSFPDVCSCCVILLYFGPQSPHHALVRVVLKTSNGTTWCLQGLLLNLWSVTCILVYTLAHPSSCNCSSMVMRSRLPFTITQAPTSGITVALVQGKHVLLLHAAYGADTEYSIQQL